MGTQTGSARNHRIAWRLRRLFTRKSDGWGERSHPEAVNDLIPFIVAGRLTVRMMRLPLAACEEGARALIGSGARESIEHLRLKRAALAWMRSEGADDAEQEVRGYGGRFDVYSGKADWIAEAGNSSITKLVNAIRDEDHPRFTLIPYQAVDRADDTPRRLIAIDFVWDDAVTRDLSDAIHERARAAERETDRRYRARMIAEAQARKAARAT